jgi:hypothetical protein
VKENLHNRDFLIRYLLKDLPDEQAAELEERFFSDDALFEQLEIAENELADDYAQGKLSGSRLEKFEAVFTDSPALRRKLEVSSLLYQAGAAEEKIPLADLTETTGEPGKIAAAPPARAEHPGWWERIGLYLRAPQLAAGFAVLVILLGGGWWLVRHNSQSNETLIAVQKTPAPVNNDFPSVAPAGSNLQNPPSVPANEAPVNEQHQAANENQNVSPKTNGARKPQPAAATAPKPSPTPPPPPLKRAQPVFAFLALSGAGGVRSSGGNGTKTLVLSENTTAARLRLAFEESDYAVNEAVARTVDGQEIWRGKAAGSVKAGSGPQSVTIEIPGRRLPAGDYLITLSGTGTTGTRETIEEYYFTVKR